MPRPASLVRSGITLQGRVHVLGLPSVVQGHWSGVAWLALRGSPPLSPKELSQLGPRMMQASELGRT